MGVRVCVNMDSGRVGRVDVSRVRGGGIHNHDHQQNIGCIYQVKETCMAACRTWLATPRCVTGMAASKGAEKAEETPGMTC